MKHQEIILTPEEKLQQTHQIEAFLKKNYSELVRVANKKLRRYSITHVEAEDLVGNLYPILDRLAFVNEGWAGEEDVLKQSYARIKGFVKDEAEKKSKTYYIEDQDEGFLEAQYYTIHAEQESAEESLIKAEIIQGAYNIAGDDPYRLALIGIWSGERTVTEVAQEYQKHKSTVSHDKSDLMQEIREYMVKEGLV